MKLVTWNVNGLRSAFNKGFSDFLNAESPEILMLQEVKAHPEQLSELLKAYKDEYQIFFSPAVKKGYSGVSTWVKRSQKIYSNKFGLGEQSFDQEGRYLITDIGGHLIYNVYFPSGTSGELRQNFKYKFLDHLIEHLHALPSTDFNRLVLGGDFNICHKEIDIHHPVEATKRKLTGFLPEERAWMDKLVQAGFLDCFREVAGEGTRQYSWWSYRAGAKAKNLGWRIDYIFVEKSLKGLVKDAALYNAIKGSDHCPMMTIIS